MTPYTHYKNTYIAWLGEVPSHWEVKKLKFFGFIYAGINGKSGDDFSKDFKENQNFKPFIPFTNICNNSIIDTLNYQYVKVNKFENQNKVLNGDVLFLMSSETLDDIAKSSLYIGQDDELYLNSFCKAFRITKRKNLLPKFLNYFLLSQSCRDYFSLVARGFTRINLKQEYVNNLNILIPPLPEQTAIANFLDKKTAQIKEAIALKSEQIDKLKEYRQTLINQTVTQGLNPSVAIKNSGAEWLGEVPEHWEILALKRVITEHSGNGFPIELQGDNGSVPFLKVSDFSLNKDKCISQWNNSVSEKTAKLKKWNLVPKGSLVTAKIGEALRKNHRKVLMENSIIDNNCLGIEFIGINPLFGYYLHCAIDFDWFVNEGAVPSLSMDKYRNFKIPLPPLSEQTAIADFLDKKTAQIDTAIEQYQAQIERLKEYLQSLINEVVTGKVRVE